MQCSQHHFRYYEFHLAISLKFSEFDLFKGINWLILEIFGVLPTRIVPRTQNSALETVLRVAALLSGFNNSEKFIKAIRRQVNDNFPRELWRIATKEGV